LGCWVLRFLHSGLWIDMHCIACAHSAFLRVRYGVVHGIRNRRYVVSSFQCQQFGWFMAEEVYMDYGLLT
jgi:hypothetical protein